MGHFGMRKTLEVLHKHFYWPIMKCYVERVFDRYIPNMKRDVEKVCD